MTAKRKLVVLLGLGLLAGTPLLAQPVQSSEDCRLPGGCGTSGKPGGVERAPEEMRPATRGLSPSRAMPPAPPAAAAPAPAMPVPVPPPAPAPASPPPATR